MLFRVWILSCLVVFVLLYNAECVITNWTKPVIKTAEGSGTLTEKINNGVTSGDATGITITANSDDNGGVKAYSKLLQNPSTPFLAISKTGVVTVTSGTVNYSTATSFTLTVSANDAGGTAKTATITLSVNVAPSFSPYSSSPCIEDDAVAGTKLITLSATDSNSDDVITYAIASGDAKSDFKITTKGVVEVNTGKTLDMAATSSYTLVITATDNSSTTLVTSATVTATVSTTCSSAKADSSTTTVTATITSTGSSAALLAASFMTILSALIVTLQ